MRTSGPICTVAGLLLGVAGLAGCGLGQEGTSLAKMVNRELHFSLSNTFLSISLFADGCPLLVPGTVDATLNGHPLEISPGRHGSGIWEGPCYQPRFSLSTLPDDLGSTLTFVIKDRTLTLRAVISGHHPELPMLEPAPSEPRVLRRADVVAIGFTSPADPPDHVFVSFSVKGTPTGGGACSHYPQADASIAIGQIEFQVPSTVCISPGSLRVCVGYTARPRLETCENATCFFDPTIAEACQVYPVTIEP
jgi:hypothetical protein